MVLRAFCRADVNSDFSVKVATSTPYKLSSDLSSESDMDEISGRSDMIALWWCVVVVCNCFCCLCAPGAGVTGVGKVSKFSQMY
jgi:hypothetical protein